MQRQHINLLYDLSQLDYLYFPLTILLTIMMCQKHQITYNITHYSTQTLRLLDQQSSVQNWKCSKLTKVLTLYRQYRQMQKTPTTMDKLLELIDQGSSDGAMLCLSAFNEMQAQPIDIVNYQDEVETQLLPSRIFVDSFAQTEPQKKEELMLQLKSLQLQRKRLEIENLVDQQNRRERARQIQQSNIEQLSKTVQARLQELADKYREIEKWRDIQTMVINQKKQFQREKEEFTRQIQLFKQERVAFQQEKIEWDFKIDQFIEQTRADSQEVQKIRSELERYHMEKDQIQSSKRNYIRQLEKLKQSQSQLEKSWEKYHDQNDILFQRAIKLAQDRAQLQLQSQELSRHRHELEFQINNLKSIIRNYQITKNNSEPKPPQCPNLQRHKKRSQVLQTLLLNLTKVKNLQRLFQTQAKKSFFSALIIRKRIYDSLNTFQRLVIDRIKGTFFIIKQNLSTKRIQHQKLSVNALKSPQIKKNLVIKRNSSVNNPVKLEALADKTDQYDNLLVFSHRPSVHQPFFHGPGWTERSQQKINSSFTETQNNKFTQSYRVSLASMCVLEDIVLKGQQVTPKTTQSLNFSRGLERGLRQKIEKDRPQRMQRKQKKRSDVYHTQPSSKEKNGFRNQKRLTINLHHMLQ